VERYAGFGIALALALAYAGVAATSPVSTGIWRDDGIYVATATALAGGSGYRHEELASRPLQTKYPILYPALLATVVRATPGFPANHAWLLFPTALAAAALVTLSMGYCRAVFGLSARAVWPLGALVAASPALVAFVRYPMSELLYGALAVGALVCLDHRREAAVDAKTARRWLVLGGLLVGLALLTRTIGVTLAFAAVALPLARRRFAEAGIVVVAIAACGLPWWIWQAWAAHANGPVQSALLENVELSYTAWLPPAWSELARVAAHNGLRAALGLVYFQLAAPEGFVMSALAGDGAIGLHVVAWIAVAAVTLGFARSLRGGVRTLHVYALAYAGAVLVWPFEPYRFLVPWTPFLLVFLFWGLWFPGYGRRVPLAVGVAVAWLFALEAGRILSSTEDRFHLRERTEALDLTEFTAVEAWIRENTAGDDVIASAWPARVFLTTGRRGVVTWPDRDPYARYYGRDRSFASFTAVPARSETEAMVKDIHAHWRDAFREAGVTVYVEARDERDARAFATAVRDQSAAFEPAFVTPGESFRIYRVLP
jgi:hypothetical protein